MSNHDPVDVLIIGAGASGAAIAWSLLETRMRILCLEQGDHLADKDYPSRRTSESTPAFSHERLKRRSAMSNGSFSLTLT